jgi:UDP-N-acetylglucosamine-lysosomal-enzyme
MIGSNKTEVMPKLDGIRHRRHKFLCLNDNMNHSNPESVKVVQAVHELLEALFPLPSPYELPPGQTNPYLHLDELLEA